MSVAKLPNIKINEGKCPHGLPHGACPACSGGGGGGIRKKGEMTWDECYAIGLQIQAAARRAEQRKLDNDLAFNQLVAIQRMIQALSQKFAPVLNFIQANIIAPVSNFISKLPITKPLAEFTAVLADKFARIKEGFKQFLNNNLPNIMDKLTALFGEEKKVLKEYFSNTLKRNKKKFLVFLGFVDASMEQGEHEQQYVEDVEDVLDLLFPNAPNPEMR